MENAEVSAAPAIVRTPEDISADWLAVKKVEDGAKALRYKIEAELLLQVEAKPEGSKTTKLNGFKVETDGVVNRKVDWAIFDMVSKQLKAENEDFVAPEKEPKRELDVTGIKWIQTNFPAQYHRLSAAITATPGKTGVKITRTE